jgi:hypothetical protein
MSPEPGDDVFSAADLEPTAAQQQAEQGAQQAAERRGERLAALDRAACAVAAAALGLWAGGLIALGACAAPFVFQLTPYPFSGQAMGAAFRRFDGIAIGCAVTLLAAEVVRTLLLGRRKQPWSARVRRYLAIAIAVAAVYSGTRLTPSIMDLHAAGARRNVGAEGSELERLHRQAELIGKVTVPAALVLIGLHVFTLRRRDNDDDAPAPGLPGAPK